MIRKTSKPIALPKPSLKRSKSVAQALKLRQTVREIGDRKLSRQLLSDLLWAACGVNREEGPFDVPGRTAATASNSQEIDVFVLLEEGAFLYEPLRHRLLPVVAEDLRRLAIGRGQAGWGEKAPVRLVFVADVDRLAHTQGFQEPGLQDPEVQRSYYFADTGLIAGNVYLFAASVGLAAWFHNCDRSALAARLGLRKAQRPTFGQTIGYPAKTRKRGTP
ncbi:MAG TPA: nitroreductase family protein [Myxococcales bacterium]|jgi:nitroreductase